MLAELTRRQDAATRIQSRYRGRSVRTEVYRFLVEREARRDASWRNVKEEAEQMQVHAEELLQQGADALAKARQFAASAAQDRARGTDNDAAFEKWLASRFPKDKPRTPRSARPQVSYLHDSYSQPASAAKAKGSHGKGESAASYQRLEQLASEHHEREGKLRAKKEQLDRERAAAEEEACIDWTEAVLRTELGALKLGTLRKRAKEAGAADEAMDEAADSDDEKAALVNLVLSCTQQPAEALSNLRGHRRSKRASGQTASVREAPAREERSHAAVGDRLHAWGEKRRDDRVARQDDWMAEKRRRSPGRRKEWTPQISARSRKLAQHRTPEEMLSHFDKWQKQKEEKLEQARKDKQEETEAEEMKQGAPDISQGFSRHIQLQRSGSIMERYTQDGTWAASGAGSAGDRSADAGGIDSPTGRTLLQLERELQGMNVSALRKRAAEDRISEDMLGGGNWEGVPKRALVQLIALAEVPAPFIASRAKGTFASKKKLTQQDGHLKPTQTSATRKTSRRKRDEEKERFIQKRVDQAAAAFEAMKEKDLQKELASRRLATTGSRSDVIKRLNEAAEKEAQRAWTQTHRCAGADEVPFGEAFLDNSMHHRDPGSLPAKHVRRPRSQQPDLSVSFCASMAADNSERSLSGFTPRQDGLPVEFGDRLYAQAVEKRYESEESGFVGRREMKLLMLELGHSNQTDEEDRELDRTIDKMMDQLDPEWDFESAGETFEEREAANKSRAVPLHDFKQLAFTPELCVAKKDRDATVTPWSKLLELRKSTEDTVALHRQQGPAHDRLYSRVARQSGHDRSQTFAEVFAQHSAYPRSPCSPENAPGGEDAHDAEAHQFRARPAPDFSRTSVEEATARKRQPKTPVTQKAPRAAVAPTWSQIMKMKVVPADGGRRPYAPRETKTTAVKRHSASVKSPRVQMSRNSAEVVTHKADDSVVLDFTSLQEEDPDVGALESGTGSLVPDPQQARRDLQSRHMQAMEEDESAQKTLERALEARAAAQTAEVESRTRALLAEKAEQELTSSFSTHGAKETSTSEDAEASELRERLSKERSAADPAKELPVSRSALSTDQRSASPSASVAEKTRLFAELAQEQSDGVASEPEPEPEPGPGPEPEPEPEPERQDSKPRRRST